MILKLSKLAKAVLALPRPFKRAVALASDAGLCVLSVWLAFYLRLGDFVPLSDVVFSVVGLTALASVFFAIPIFVKSGLYRAIFRYSGLPAMVAMGRAMLLYGVVFAAVFTFYGVQGVPRTVGLIQPLLVLFLVGASRALARYWLGGLYLSQLRLGTLPKVLIYGAGSAGRQLANAMANMAGNPL